FLESPLGVLAKRQDFSASQDRPFKPLCVWRNNGAVEQLANRGIFQGPVLAVVVPARGHPAQEWFFSLIIGRSRQHISGHAHISRTALDQALPMLRSGVMGEFELGKPCADSVRLTVVLAPNLQAGLALHQREGGYRKSP